MTSRTSTSTSRRPSTSGWVARSGPTQRSSTGWTGAMPVDRVPGRAAPGGHAVPRGAPPRRAVPPLGAAHQRRRAAVHAGRCCRGGDVVKRYRIREQMNGITEPPGKVWFWELEAGVIHADRCIQCGTCVAVCPSNSIGVNEDTDLPELVKMCTGCSLCWDFCPRGGLRYEALWPPSTGGERTRTPRCSPPRSVPTPRTRTGRSAAARRRRVSARSSSPTPSERVRKSTTRRTAARSARC